MSWPHGRQLYTCSWKSLTVLAGASLGDRTWVLPVTGAYVWLLIAAYDSAGTKAGTLTAANSTSSVEVAFFPFIYAFFSLADKHLRSWTIKSNHKYRGI